MLGLSGIGPVRAVCYRMIFRGIFETDELAKLLEDMPPPRRPLLAEWRRTANDVGVAVGLIVLRAVLPTEPDSADGGRRYPSARSLFPRVWELFPFILGRKLRTEIYEPAHEELREDFVRAQLYTGAWAKRWLVFAFTVRTALLVLECLRVAAGERVMRALGGLAQEFIRRLFHLG